MSKIIIQIGSHIGNTENDKLFNSNEISINDKIYLVEPVEFLFNELINNYKKKFNNNINNITFINKAISNHNGNLNIYIPIKNLNEKIDNDLEQKLPYWLNQISSVNEKHIIDHIINFPDNIKKQLNIGKINIDCITLNVLIEEYNINKIDHLLIDTEGHDYDILMCYDFKIKPLKITFEIAHMDGYLTIGKKFIELSKKLIENNYKMTKIDNQDAEFELST